MFIIWTPPSPLSYCLNSAVSHNPHHNPPQEPNYTPSWTIRLTNISCGAPSHATLIANVSSHIEFKLSDSSNKEPKSTKVDLQAQRNNCPQQRPLHKWRSIHLPIHAHCKSWRNPWNQCNSMERRCNGSLTSPRLATVNIGKISMIFERKGTLLSPWYKSQVLIPDRKHSSTPDPRQKSRRM